MGSLCTAVNEPRDNRRRVVRGQANAAQKPHSIQLPNSRMHEYNSAVKEFMKQQEFKALARERNLNLNGKFIKSKVGIDIRTIKLEQDEDSKNIYWISFWYSARERCKITIYYGANQTWNREGLPLYFMIPTSLPSAFSCTVDKGKGVLFEGEDGACFDIERYNETPLFNSTYNYFPWVITIEPSAEPTKGEDGISDHQWLITYCHFTIDK